MGIDDVFVEGIDSRKPLALLCLVEDQADRAGEDVMEMDGSIFIDLQSKRIQQKRTATFIQSIFQEKE